MDAVSHYHYDRIALHGSGARIDDGDVSYDDRGRLLLDVALSRSRRAKGKCENDQQSEAVRVGDHAAESTPGSAGFQN